MSRPKTKARRSFRHQRPSHSELPGRQQAAAGYALRGLLAAIHSAARRRFKKQRWPYSYPQPGIKKPGAGPWSKFNRHAWSDLNRRQQSGPAACPARHSDSWGRASLNCIPKKLVGWILLGDNFPITLLGLLHLHNFHILDTYCRGTNLCCLKSPLSVREQNTLF